MSMGSTSCDVHHVTHKQVLECVDTLAARVVTQNASHYQPNKQNHVCIILGWMFRQNHVCIILGWMQIIMDYFLALFSKLVSRANISIVFSWNLQNPFMWDYLEQIYEHLPFFVADYTGVGQIIDDIECTWIDWPVNLHTVMLLTSMFIPIIQRFHRPNWSDVFLVPPGQNSVHAVTAVHWLEFLLPHTHKHAITTSAWLYIWDK